MGGSRLIAIVAIAFGCSSSSYPCTDSVQCVLGGVQGVCEQQGFCSLPDMACPSGKRFEPHAGGGLAGACVEQAPPCGGVGQACCATSTPCGDNGVCTGGSCQACVIDMEPGRHASCLIRNDHTVWCAGDNEFGQLGFGIAGAPQTSWQQARDSTGAAIADATALSLGWESACAIRAAGSVWCWGLNNFGQLGNNSTTDQHAAAQVMMSAGGALTGMVAIDNGTRATCGLDGNGSVWCWGDNEFGQLGDGTTTQRLTAVQVLDTPTGPVTSGAVALTVGDRHACIRKANNSIWCWGRNGNGELGDDSPTNRSNPVMITTASSVSAGRNQTCAVKVDGTVWCWGSNWRNRIGSGATYWYDPGKYLVPQQVVTAPEGPALGGARSVAVGGVSCALLEDGTPMCWGDNTHGQTGAGAGATTPVAVLQTDGKRLTNVDAVTAPYSRPCAHRTDGSYWCWGQNVQGAFGDGTFENHPFATPLRFSCR